MQQKTLEVFAALLDVCVLVFVSSAVVDSRIHLVIGMQPDHMLTQVTSHTFLLDDKAMLH